MDLINDSLLTANLGVLRSIIYADPPWSYKSGTFKNGLASDHYETMSLKDLKQLCVPAICAKDCMLFLWTTGCQMSDSIELMESWGFKYKTMFITWVKTTAGSVKPNSLGFYTRQSCEFVLLGSKGHIYQFKNKENNNAVSNFYLSDSQEHSRKPLFVKNLINHMFHNVPKIELFARDSTDEAWDYWGDELDKF